ncbi:MAG TPA: hypothetical protein VFY39_00120 [Gammaproteobacteria bacterium]|nr:hypothetical protein [Gammaproteobacteria bacterium]
MLDSPLDVTEALMKEAAMNTYPIKDAEGHPYAIEVDNAYVSVRSLAQLLGVVEGVAGVEVRKPFSRSGDAQAKFRFLDADYLIVEPFGDNSRYWIGPADDRRGRRDITLIEAHLKAYKPSILRKLVGDMVTLNVRSLLGG